MKGENGVKLKCNVCGYTWLYTGKKKVLATCPDCIHKIKIAECKVA